jgi:hypothetical protein
MESEGDPTLEYMFGFMTDLNIYPLCLYISSAHIQPVANQHLFLPQGSSLVLSLAYLCVLVLNVVSQ